MKRGQTTRNDNRYCVPGIVVSGIVTQAKNKPEMTDLIDGSIGEESQFHITHGFYVHGVSIEAAMLPDDWADRTKIVSHPIATRGYKGHCLEVHDLAASKLYAYREKDRIFVTTLLLEKLIDVPISLNV